jgi:hypothetical protein
MAEKKEENWFKKTEAKLYAYPALIAKHRQKLAEYIALKPYPKARAHTAVSFIRGGVVDGEAERWVLSREKIAQCILFLESKVQEEVYDIAALWEILSAPERDFIRMRYFEDNAVTTVFNALNYSATQFYRIRQRSVLKAAYIYSFLTYEEYLSILSERKQK